MLPGDPFVMLSFINTKLRDSFSSLDELCESLECEKEFVINKMQEIGYEYIAKYNQFR